MSDAAPRGKHILVIDDTEEVIELFRDILEGMGHRVTATNFAPEDLAEVSKVGPDLVILDMMLGGEAVGWQLAQKMRMSPETAKVPIVICAAATKAVGEQEGWLAGQSIKIVLKPFWLEDLERAVNRAFALPELMA